VTDGSRLEIRLSWLDASSDDLALDQQEFDDGAAVQLSASAVPPFFAMGEAAREVNIWYWKASWERDATELQRDIRQAYPNQQRLEGELAGAAPNYNTSVDAGNPVAAMERDGTTADLNASGFGTLRYPGCRRPERRWCG